MGGRGLYQSGLGQEQVAVCCECGNKPSGSIKCVEFLDQMRTYSFSGRSLLSGVS
jgi:hypothetical protein